jgi:hypothetical protein
VTVLGAGVPPPPELGAGELYDDGLEELLLQAEANKSIAPAAMDAKKTGSLFIVTLLMCDMVVDSAAVLLFATLQLAGRFPRLKIFVLLLYH